MKNYHLSLASVLAVLFLAGCQDHGHFTSDTAQDGVSSFEKIMAQKLADESKKDIREGLQALMDQNYQLASQRFNTALIDDPSNSFLHYVNGLTYHSLARKGDITQFDLAQAGFEQAIKFNPSNYLACLQLARVKADQKKYTEAQEEYAGVLLLKPDHAEALYEMANVSYYLGDLRNAQMAINRALNKLGNDPKAQQTAVMIYAAAGKNDKAREHFMRYQQLSGKNESYEHLLGRVEDWQKLYEKGIVLAQADVSSQADFAKDAPDAPADSSASPPPAAPSPAAAPQSPTQGQMIVVDAITMRVSETGSTSKGNNILDKFTLTISPGSHMYARGNSGANTGGSTRFFLPSADGTYTNPDVSHTAGTLGATRVFSQGISFGAIHYSLNIANAAREHIEVIGRPSLVATVGSPESAKFFSGDHLALGLAPQTGGSAGSIQQLPVGVTLEINAISLKDGFVTLDVQLYGSILNNNDLRRPDGSPANPTEQFTRIGLSKIKTRVKVKLGETIMLAGITERIDTQNKAGFPGLQDLPLIQYLFSREDTSSFRKSVVYMLTPHSYDSNKNAIRTLASSPQQPNLKELALRNVDWYDPAYNMVVAFKNLTPLYREFRQGDLPPLTWDMTEKHEENVSQALSFLYF